MLEGVAYFTGAVILIVAGLAAASALVITGLNYCYVRMQAGKEFVAFYRSRKDPEWNQKWLMIARYNAQVIVNPIERLAAERGWEPLQVGEFMTISHDNEVYQISRVEDDDSRPEQRMPKEPEPQAVFNDDNWTPGAL